MEYKALSVRLGGTRRELKYWKVPDILEHFFRKKELNVRVENFVMEANWGEIEKNRSNAIKVPSQWENDDWRSAAPVLAALARYLPPMRAQYWKYIGIITMFCTASVLTEPTLAASVDAILEKKIRQI